MLSLDHWFHIFEYLENDDLFNLSYVNKEIKYYVCEFVKHLVAKSSHKYKINLYFMCYRELDKLVIDNLRYVKQNSLSILEVNKIEYESLVNSIIDNFFSIEIFLKKTAKIPYFNKTTDIDDDFDESGLQYYMDEFYEDPSKHQKQIANIFTHMQNVIDLENDIFNVLNGKITNDDLKSWMRVFLIPKRKQKKILLVNKILNLLYEIDQGKQMLRDAEEINNNWFKCTLTEQEMSEYFSNKNYSNQITMWYYLCNYHRYKLDEHRFIFINNDRYILAVKHPATKRYTYEEIDINNLINIPLNDIPLEEPLNDLSILSESEKKLLDNCISSPKVFHNSLPDGTFIGFNKELSDMKYKQNNATYVSNPIVLAEFTSKNNLYEKKKITQEYISELKTAIENMYSEIKEILENNSANDDN